MEHHGTHTQRHTETHRDTQRHTGGHANIRETVNPAARGKFKISRTSCMHPLLPLSRMLRSPSAIHDSHGKNVYPRWRLMPIGTSKVVTSCSCGISRARLAQRPQDSAP
eukprot:2211800-Karenia_brevis.AAC.1